MEHRTRDRGASWLARIFARHAEPGPAAVPGDALSLRLELARTERKLQSFAGAMVHELRTPLSALSGEVELALRRDRAPGEYREVLARIAERVTELVDLTDNLAFLGHSPDARVLSGRTTHLGAVFAYLDERYKSRNTPHLTFEIVLPGIKVMGDEKLLTRALTLLVEHAIRHRRDAAPVRLSATSSADAPLDSDAVDLSLDAAPPGFSRHTWHHLADDAAEDHVIQAPGMLRLRTAARIVQNCGGSLDVHWADESASVHLQFRRARARADGALDGPDR